MKAGGWRENTDKISSDRIYTGTDYDRYAFEGDKAGSELLELPGLLMPEVKSSEEQTAQIVVVLSAVKRAGNVIIEYEPFNVAPIKVTDILNYTAELDIATGGYMLSHTHWSVRNADLISILKKHGLLSGPLQPVNRQARNAKRAAIRSNEDKIVAMAAALAHAIDERIEARKNERPNDAAAIEARDREIVELEALKAQVVALQAEIAKLQRGEIEEINAVIAAETFESKVGTILRDHPEIVVGTIKSGLMAGFVGLFTLLGVNPELCFAGTLAMIGGGDIAELVGGILKSLRG